MKTVLLILLSLLVFLIVTFIFFVRQAVEIFIHYKEKRLFIELRGTFFKKVLIDRDYSGTEKKSDNKKEKKEGRFSRRFKADKERIYNSQKGEYNHQELKNVFGEYKEIYGQVKDVLGDFVEDLRHKIEIPRLEIDLEYGTGDPAKTGMLYGGIWGAVGTVYPIAARYFHIAYPVLNVTPDYNETRFKIEVKSIIRVKPSHIINAVFKQGMWSVITYSYKNFIKGSVKNG